LFKYKSNGQNDVIVKLQPCVNNFEFEIFRSVEDAIASKN